MLMIGNSSNIIDAERIYNISSLKEGYQRLSTLIPPNQIGFLTGKDFDIAYANYILSNDNVFMEFFQIIESLYEGLDVYLIVSDEDWSENLIESLLKLIQQRYGYNGIIISSFQDYLYYVNSRNIFGFNPDYGIANLDVDKQRYAYILANTSPKVFNHEY